MKRKMVVGVSLGGAAVVMAAVPFGGALVASAADTTAMTEEINITIEAGCGFVTTPDTTPIVRSLGQGSVFRDIEGTTFEIKCNFADMADGSWTLTAGGVGNDNTMSDGQGNTIPSENGTLDGTTSNWAFKISSNDARVKIDGGYNDYSQIPTAPTTVASGSGTVTAGAATVQTYYGVSASKTQTAGTYTGKVEYTLTSLATEAP